jgi:hypothetical protein
MSTTEIVLTPKEQREYKTRTESIKQGITSVAEDLKYVRDNKLYRHEYDTFEKYVALEFEKTRQWAYTQIGHVEVVSNIQNVNSSLHLPTVSQAHALASLPDEEQPEAYEQATNAAKSEGKEKPTTKHVKEAVSQRKNALSGVYEPPAKEPKRDLTGPDPKEFHTYIGQAMRFLDRYYGHHKMKDDPQVEEIRDSLGDAAGKHGELVGDLA